MYGKCFKELIFITQIIIEILKKKVLLLVSIIVQWLHTHFLANNNGKWPVSFEMKTVSC